jgi:hypothetical protein
MGSSAESHVLRRTALRDLCRSLALQYAVHGPVIPVEVEDDPDADDYEPVASHEILSVR